MCKEVGSKVYEGGGREVRSGGQKRGNGKDGRSAGESRLERRW